MRKIAFTLMALLAMTSVTYAVTFDYIQNADPAAGLASYTVRVTGTAINDLGTFTIAGPVNQTDDEWSHTNSTNLATDTCVVYGDMRLPDVEGENGDMWDYVNQPGPRPTPTTVETGSGVGGTLNNYAAGPPATWDNYFSYAAPSTSDITSNLLQIVLKQGTAVTVNATVWTDAGVSSASGNIVITAPPLYGDCDLDGDVDANDFAAFATGWYGTAPASWATGDFVAPIGTINADDFAAFAAGWYGPYYETPPDASVPEPSTIAMLILGALCLAGYRLRK